MNYRAIFAIVRKDLKVVSQNKGVMLPIIVLTVVFFVVVTLVVTWFLPLVENMAGQMISTISRNCSPACQRGLQQDFAGYESHPDHDRICPVYMLAPMFLIVPLMVASVIAADSFAGEKERKTLEALLYTPTTDRELFVAKLLSGWLAAIAVALVGFVLYAVMANAAAWSQMHRIFFPNAMWLVLILWVVPAIAGLGVGADGAGIITRTGLPGCQPAGWSGGAADRGTVLSASGRRDVLQCHRGDFDGVGGLAVDWIVYLVGQPDLSAQPVVSGLTFHSLLPCHYVIVNIELPIGKGVFSA